MKGKKIGQLEKNCPDVDNLESSDVSDEDKAVDKDSQATESRVCKSAHCHCEADWIVHTLFGYYSESWGVGVVVVKVLYFSYLSAARYTSTLVALTPEPSLYSCSMWKCCVSLIRNQRKSYPRSFQTLLYTARMFTLTASSTRAPTASLMRCPPSLNPRPANLSKKLVGS